jgi:hypothetical protein
MIMMRMRRMTMMMRMLMRRMRMRRMRMRMRMKRMRTMMTITLRRDACCAPVSLLTLFLLSSFLSAYFGEKSLDRMVRFSSFVSTHPPHPHHDPSSLLHDHRSLPFLLDDLFLLGAVISSVVAGTPTHTHTTRVWIIMDIYGISFIDILAIFVLW